NNPLYAYFSLKSGLEEWVCANDLGAFDTPYLLCLLGVYQ
ncbi:11856_t:CDS:1, partial [Rhizophagus irregularis]